MGKQATLSAGFTALGLYCTGIPTARLCFPYRFSAQLQRLAEVAAGMATLRIVDFCFDYLLYPLVIQRLGTACGALLMTLLDFVACFVTLLFYDWSKRDWFGLEELKRLTDYRGEQEILRGLSRLLKKNEAIMFFFLSLRFDAFVTTAYFRQEAFGGLNQGEWKTFLSSLLLGNLAWSAACSIGSTLFGHL